MAKPRRQTKLYRCPNCEAAYLHDLAYRHHCFECPARRRTAVRLPGKRLRLLGRNGREVTT